MIFKLKSQDLTFCHRTPRKQKTNFGFVEELDQDEIHETVEVSRESERGTRSRKKQENHDELLQHVSN